VDCREVVVGRCAGKNSYACKARKFNGGLSVISWHKILHKKAGRGIQVVMAVVVVVVARRVKGGEGNGWGLDGN
jgi:hypothetical protein